MSSSTGSTICHQIVRAAGWQRFILLGHSLGALIASAYAGVFPEQIVRLHPAGGAWAAEPTR